ncbi:CapA family protein [Kitasatospora sp. NPDC097643]|uniref:CapA family protein n=1 Tax=Kitasatospora sp. NPDC097643 TaxID=3157230 RepID=UPI003325182B
MSFTVALAGDTMLGRSVADQLRHSARADALLAAELRDVIGTADLFVLNLECCISERGEPWPAPGKEFFFRAPPSAAEVLAELGADCVTLANNHALDYGRDALADTLTLLARSGIRTVGAGENTAAAREFTVLEAGGSRLAVIGVADHPPDYAAHAHRPGTAYADLRHGVPAWLTALVGRAAEAADAVLVTPHWGPNMTTRPPHHVRAAARALLPAGATLIAGHSAHVFHGVAGPVVYDLGDFIDDYAVHPWLRNDLGLLYLATFDGPDPRHLAVTRLEAIPLVLGFCHTRPAEGEDRTWIRDRLTLACAELGTAVTERDGRLLVDVPSPAGGSANLPG